MGQDTLRGMLLCGLSACKHDCSITGLLLPHPTILRHSLLSTGPHFVPDWLGPLTFCFVPAGVLSSLQIDPAQMMPFDYSEIDSSPQGL